MKKLYKETAGMSKGKEKIAGNAVVGTGRYKVFTRQAVLRFRTIEEAERAYTEETGAAVLYDPSKTYFIYARREEYSHFYKWEMNSRLTARTFCDSY